MMRRLAAAAVAAALVGVPSPAPAAVAGGGNLLGNPFFASLTDSTPTGWRCDPGATTGDVSPGSEFIQMAALDAPEVPKLPPAPIPRPPAPTALAAAARPGTVLPGASPEPRTWLDGQPTATSAAGCSQIVPVRGGARYTLSVQVSGGEAVLATEYGQASAHAGASSTVLTMTFTTARNRDTVRVRIHGRVGGDEYVAMAAALVGPPSRTRSPVTPTVPFMDRRTSRWVSLRWLPAAGATGYEVRRDGVPLGRVAGPSALVLGLTPGQAYSFTVVALNDACPSAPSPAVAVGTLPAYAEPPDVPLVDGVDVYPGTDGTASAVVQFDDSAEATDGYFVYLDGVRIGWVYGPPGEVPGLVAGTHTLQLSAVDTAGESALSDPVDVVVGGGSAR